MSHAFDTRKESQQSINFKKKWFSAHQDVVKRQSLEETIRSIQTLENNSIFSSEMIVVYRTQDIMPLYVSKNVEKVLGYSQEEFLSWEEGAFLKIGAMDQPSYYPNLLKWEESFVKNCPHRSAETKARGHFCGVRYLCKDGTRRRFMLRQEFTLGENLTLPEFDLLYFEDITHLVKNEDYWIMIESYGKNENYSRFFRKEGEFSYPITDREKEVLLLIANGKSTKEVASELNISPDTVGQHRKNMIRRTMAKDTSSLIQLCKICNII